MSDVVTRSGKSLIIPKSLRNKSFQVSPLLEGSRRWLSNGSFSVEETEHNRTKMEGCGLTLPERPEEPASGTSRDIDVGSYWRPPFCPPKGYFSPAKDRWVEFMEFPHQEEAFEKFKDLKGPSNRKGVFALFAEAGTGKTKIAIDLLAYDWCNNEIDAVLVLAKKGVHHQWVRPKQIDAGVVDSSPVEMFLQLDIPWDGHSWDGKPVPDALFTKDNRMKWLTVNFDAPIHKKASEVVDRFMEAHEGRVAVIGDETHYWITPRSKRTERALEINKTRGVRRSGIMTGTPLAKNLVDEWSQMRMLDEAIIGHRYVTTFKRDFCVMGGFEGRQVIGHKDIDRFKDLTSPYIFRVLKRDCINLPPKQHKVVEFELSREQRKAISFIRANHEWEDERGMIHEWEGAAAIQSKIQEISNGYLRFDGKTIATFPNPRLSATLELLEENPQKAIIWTRFRPEIDQLKEVFGERAVEYHGGVDDAGRELAKQMFISQNEGVDYFLATCAAAEGLDGLQTVCSQAVYYSNGTNFVHRSQSEDRIDRIGQKGSSVYWDIIAKGCIDYPLLRGLRDKRSFSELVLDIEKDLDKEVDK